MENHNLETLLSTQLSSFLQLQNQVFSSFIELKDHTSSQFDFEAGYGGDKAVVEYLKEYRLNNPTVSKEELDKMRKELYPNGSKTEFEKEFKE